MTSGEAGGSEGTTAHELSEGHSAGAPDHHGNSQVPGSVPFLVSRVSSTSLVAIALVTSRSSLTRSAGAILTISRGPAVQIPLRFVL